MTEETRDEKLLRILLSGISGKEDWELAKYLIDKKYANGEALLSRMRSSFGEILDIYLQGPTADGLDYIELLKEKIEQAKKINTIESAQISKKTPNEKQWHERPIGIIGIGVFVGVVIYLAEHAFDNLGIFR